MVKKDDLNIGDVIYFVDYVRTGDFHPTVRFAVVADLFSDGIDVDFYRPYDERYVRVEWDKFKSAIPIEDYEWDGRWHKLPKGWTYNTMLYDVEHRHSKGDLSHVMLNDKDGIKKAIKDGLLIRNQDNPFYVIDSVITKDGYKIVKIVNTDHTLNCNQWSDIIAYDKAFLTYEDAQKELTAYNAELARQANLTDEEWSIEEINKEIDRYIHLYGDRKDFAEKARAYILALPHIEDVEVRIFNSSIQYKYFKNKKWITVSGENL